MIYIRIVLDHDGLSIGTSEKDSEPLIGCLGLDETEWVDARGLQTTCTIVYWNLSMTVLTIGPHGVGALA